MMQTSCIIPFYNEGRRLFSVLNEISKVSNLAEIICIDDASHEDSTVELRECFPKIRFFRLPKNMGKSGAVREGLKHSTSNLILLFDADLQNLDHKEIEKAIDAIQQTPDVDMLILRRVKAPLIIRLLRGDVTVTGERILKKKDLEIILSGSVKGWQLESAINAWMHQRKKKVFWVPHSGINIHKPWKWGLLSGLKHDIRTLADMISGAGLMNLLKQTLFFARDELKLK